MRWTEEQLRDYEQRRNKTGGVPSGAEPERSVHHEPVATQKRDDPNPVRRVVRITSYRLRLVDERNLADKYFTDALIYAGILHGDSPDEAEIIVRQEKVTERAFERTEIIVSS